MDLQAYLSKRYGAATDSASLKPEKKKKKKKKQAEKKNQAATYKGVKIVDDDAVWQKNIDEDSEEGEEEAPAVVENEEINRMRWLEQLRRKNLIRGEDGSGWVEVTPTTENGSSPKVRNDSPDLSSVRRGASEDAEESPPRRRNGSSPDLSPPRGRQLSPDSSPPRQRTERQLSPDLSTPRQRGRRHDSPDASPREASPDSDLSPPRRGRQNEQDQDISPPRRRGNLDQDLSPPRRHDSPDLSPPRRRVKQEDDLSPPRRRVNMDQDLSPARRRHDSPDLSPPRRRVKQEEDLSPPRRRGNLDEDLSPPRRRHDSPDLSPPRRKAKQEELPRRRGNMDQDLSPPRRRHDSSDLSPPRRRVKQDEDLSPPRRRGKLDRDLSPRRRHDSPDLSRRRVKQEGDLSPPRRRHGSPDVSPVRKRRRNDSPGDSPTRRNEANHGKQRKAGAESGKNAVPEKAGLKTGRELRQEINQKQLQDAKMFDQLDSSVTGRGAETVYRDKHGRRLAGLEEFMKQQQGPAKPAEKPLEWGSGLAQKREAERRQKELDAAKEEPFARSKDVLDAVFKNRIRWGDPMAHLVKQNDVQLEDFSRNERMKESGFNVPQDTPAHSWLKRGHAATPNRYNIRPGRHWDGVDRSNGFEEKLFKQQNEKKAMVETAYRWSVADM